MRSGCTYIRQTSGFRPNRHKSVKAPVPVTFSFVGKVLCAHFTEVREEP